MGLVVESRGRVDCQNTSKMADAAVIEKLEAGFKKVSEATNCKSLLKKYLTKEVFDQLKDKKTFLVWCNEEDHLRIISMQMGGDLGCVVRRLIGGVTEIEKRIPFSHHDRLGFLTFCPTNLGTTVRASVHIKLPKLAANREKLEEVAGKYNLQVRGTRGEHTEAEGGIYDISNKRRMGLTEFQAIMEMQNGILELIKMEKEM